MIKVLVVDDHRVFTELLSLALDATADIACVATATTAAEGLAKLAAYEIDVVVLDVRLPDGDGLQLVHPVLALRPSCRVVLLTAHPRADHAATALAAGAVAFLAKDERLDDLLAAVRSASTTRPVLSRTLPASPHEVVDLTPREWDVLGALARGRAAAEIADELDLSQHTVRDHIKGLLRKLGARSQLEAVARARELGALDSSLG
ncbi:response regulator [Microbacterium sp. NPDC078428]|uniref:response regulator transcription factor n=1 Tax=Microbacterium sp. NPDC078428 TaxID=3364190 RepID=UPI0037C4F619